MAQENSLVKTLEKMNISSLKFLGVWRPLLGTFGRGGADSWTPALPGEIDIPTCTQLLTFQCEHRTKSHDLTMLWYEHSRFFILSSKHYQGSMLSFPEFPWVFTSLFVYLCVISSPQLWSHNLQVPDCDQQEYSALLIWSTKLYWTRWLRRWGQCQAPRSSIVPPLISIPVKHLFFYSFGTFGLHSNPCTRNNFPLISVPLSFPF